MNILSIDTTTKVASVSLLYNKRIITKSISNEITHSEKLLPLIDEILNENSIKLNDIDMYACINGPGSFTGIRIGLSTLKAFSFVDNKKIFSLSSLDLLAYCGFKKSNFYSEKKNATVISLIDAKNDRVYYAKSLLSFNEDKINITNTEKNSNYSINELFSTLNLDNNNVIFCGDCIQKYKEKITDFNHNCVCYDFYPTTEDLINSFFDIENPDKYTFDTYTLDANYVRESQAERILKNE